MALTLAQMPSPGRRASHRWRRSDLGDERDGAVETDPDAVGVAVDVGHRDGPDVARAAVGGLAEESDGVRWDDGEGGAVDEVSGDDPPAG